MVVCRSSEATMCRQVLKCTLFWSNVWPFGFFSVPLRYLTLQNYIIMCHSYKSDLQVLKQAFDLLNDIDASVKCGATIDTRGETWRLDGLYYMCKRLVADIDTAMSCQSLKLK